MTEELASRNRRSEHQRFQRVQTETFLSLLRGRTYGTVCDVGCGKGFWDYLLIREHLATSAVIGCDIFRDFQTQELRRANPGIHVEFRSICDGTLPLEDGSVDLCLSMDVIEHVEDDAKFIEEHFRVTRPGGVILIGTPNFSRLANLPLALTGRLSYPRSMGTDTYGDVTHLREYRKAELLGLMQRHSGLIRHGTLQVVGRWLGVGLTNLGIPTTPSPLERLCQFWFVKLTRSHGA